LEGFVKTIHNHIKHQDRAWYLIDAQDQVLGRLASRIASILRGKGKSSFSPQWDCGDFVVVINADKIRVTGKKDRQKQYFKPSQYPGNSKFIPYLILKERFPERILIKAVEGMIPSGALGRDVCRKLFTYAGTKHPHAAQKPIQITV
jgi:large subunit ribosomal protein L13